ncbi:MAG: N-6 DNA methylase, partial [Candidatus Omnitrophica bacterium]|nr:N-6 DNA methylase [Candidatus Omnitrophota bacterium]
LKEKTIFGSEITTNSRLAKMNMILHGDGHSGVKQLDSLENPVDNKYDIVITNMPFAQKIKESHLYYNGIAKNSGDGVCFVHCFKAAKKGGSMAFVVPEGVLFSKNLSDV